MVGRAKDLVAWLFAQDRDKLFEIKEFKEKRSLNANAYAWALIGKMADVLRTGKDSVYLTELKRYGQSEIVSVLSHINVHGVFKYYERAGVSYLGEKEFTHYRVYKGSSEYDSREMAILIDGIVEDAKELGIETMTPIEIERLKQRWNQSS